MSCHSGKSLVIFFGPWLGYVIKNNLLLISRTNVVTVAASGLVATEGERMYLCVMNSYS